MTIQHRIGKKGRGIEWCDETRNAMGGCHHRCRWQMPDGTIAMCYAEDVAENLARRAYQHGFEHHYWRAQNGLVALTKGSKPLLIFMDSMSDLFGHWVPDEQVRQVLAAIASAPHHTYQCLTKAPSRLLKFVDDMPPNLWVGVSSPPDFMMAAKGAIDPVFDGLGMKPANRLSDKQKEKMLRRTLDVLLEIKRKTGNITWMSIEPLSWDVRPIFDEFSGKSPLSWAVIGAATNGKKKFQPNPDDVAAILPWMDEHEVPVFYKGNIQKTFEDNDFGSAELNRFREDFPTSAHGQFIPAVLYREATARERGWPTNTAESLVGVDDSLLQEMLRMSMERVCSDAISNSSISLTQGSLF